MVLALSDLTLVPRLGIAAAALSLLLHDLPRLRRAAEPLAGVTGLAGLALLLGWGFGSPAFATDAFTPRAVLSVSLALIGLCLGLLAIYPGHGVGLLWASDTVGGALLRRLLLPASALAIGMGYARLELARGGQLPFASASVWLVLLGVAIVGVLIVWTSRYLDSLEQVQRAAEGRFEDLFDNARDAIYVHDLSGRYLEVNQAAQKLLGYTRDEMRAMTVAQVLAPESAQRADELLAAVRGERPPVEPDDDGLVEFEVRRKDGRHVPIEVNVRVIEEDGVPQRIEGIARDISERRFLEEQVRQVQRLDAVGRLAGGVAHDLSSHLTTILCYVRPLVERLGPRDPARGDLEQVEAAAVSAANLVQQLLAFGRRGVQQRRTVDLNDVVRPLVRLLTHQLGHGVETKLSLAADLRAVRADPTQLEQVVMNLALNARDAMPKGGSPRARDGQRRARRGRRGTAPRSRARPLRAPRGARYGHRHGPRDPGAHLRAVLHDEGARQGHRPRTRYGVRHREAERRRHRGAERARRRHRDARLPAVLRGDPGMRLAAALAALLLGCAGPAPREDDYLRYTAWETNGGESILLRWQTRRMPLKVHLPPPPAGMVDDPEAVLDAVRDGFVDWTDTAAPGVPSFVFVDDAGAADIPVVWEAAPNGEWYIAHCAMDIDFQPVRFGVSRILITTAWQGATWSLQDLYETLLHEVGHALGLLHSPNRADIMFAGKADARGLSDRDRATLRRLYGLPIGHRVAGSAQRRPIEARPSDRADR